MSPGAQIARLGHLGQRVNRYVPGGRKLFVLRLQDVSRSYQFLGSIVGDFPFARQPACGRDRAFAELTKQGGTPNGGNDQQVVGDSQPQTFAVRRRRHERTPHHHARGAHGHKVNERAPLGAKARKQQSDIENLEVHARRREHVEDVENRGKKDGPGPQVALGNLLPVHREIPHINGSGTQDGGATSGGDAPIRINPSIIWG